jgi:hypothetical protein
MAAPRHREQGRKTLTQGNFLTPGAFRPTGTGRSKAIFAVDESLRSFDAIAGHLLLLLLNRLGILEKQVAEKHD